MPARNVHRLMIGTANFGANYGIGNGGKKVSIEEIAKIVKFAEYSGVLGFDTASAYGESEEILGQMGVQESKIITKIPAFASDCRDHDQVCSSTVNQTLEKLKISRLHGVLLHRPEQLFSKSGSDIYDAMAKLKADGFTELIGCSVYDVAELKEIHQNFGFDIYQIPYNVLDRRFSENGVMKQLSSEGIKVYARSIFLQGLLLLDRKDRPSWLETHSKALNEWDNFVHDSGRPAIELCLDFVFQNPNLTGVVVGVDSVSQLKEIYEYVNMPSVDFGFTPSQIDQVLCDPRRWKKLDAQV
jgi:hypothetical protein